MGSGDKGWWETEGGRWAGVNASEVGGIFWPIEVQLLFKVTENAPVLLCACSCLSSHIGGGIEYPLQVCQLSRSSESTHFLFLRRDVALFDFTRAQDSF